MVLYMTSILVRVLRALLQVTFPPASSPPNSIHRDVLCLVCPSNPILVLLLLLLPSLMLSATLSSCLLSWRRCLPPRIHPSLGRTLAINPCMLSTLAREQWQCWERLCTVPLITFFSAFSFSFPSLEKAGYAVCSLDPSLKLINARTLLRLVLTCRWMTVSLKGAFG